MIDFDAAVRDPSDPSRINPSFDGGDHLHFNPAGYQAMANAIKLGLLRRASCIFPALKLAVSPRHVQAGKRVTLHFSVTGSQGRRTAPVVDAVITLAGHRLHTNPLGRASITRRFVRPGPIRVRVSAVGYRPVTTTIYVVAKPTRPEERPRGSSRDGDGDADSD